MQKQIQLKVKGMQRDLSASAFNPEYAYENKNIRIMPTDGSTLLSIINERGNKQSSIKGIGDSLMGTPIGQLSVDNELVVFTAGDKYLDVDDISADEETIGDIIGEESTIDLDSNFDDGIYKLWFSDGYLNGKKLFKGNLGFDFKYPIEAISFYENSDIKKVYWVDGINQPRVINIAAANDVINKWNNYSFDFVRTLKLQEEVTIKRDIVSSGTFAPGVLQYVLTYFTVYGQESNIFYTSPLYYVSYNNRGASPEDKVGNSFTIVIDNIDKSFDYVRIYSIHRTSIDAIPTVKKVVDLSIPSLEDNTKISYTDNGMSGDIIDPTELLYVGGEEVVFRTMAQKDNTLFLGDITLKRKTLDSTIKERFKWKNITFTTSNKALTPPEPRGYYPYSNQLTMNSYQFKTFKYLEYYRFGIQAQHYTGKWSEPIWINDAQNNQHIKTTFYNAGDIQLPIAQCTLYREDFKKLLTLGYVRIRPVVVYPTINDREAVCQGILCPTVYNVSDRYSNSPFAQSSWFIRPNVPFDIFKAGHYAYSSDGNPIMDLFELGSTNRTSKPSIGVLASIYSRAGIISNDRIFADSTTWGRFTVDTINKGAWAEFRHNKPIPSNDKRNAEIQCIWNPPSPYINKNYNVIDWVSENGEYYYIDQSILTFHSPDIEFDNEVRSIDTSSLKLRIVGIVPLTAFASDIDIQTSTPVNNFYKSSELPIGFYKESIGVENNFDYQMGDDTIRGDSYFGFKGLISGAFWFDEITGRKADSPNPNLQSTGFVVYPWHRNGSLNNTKFATDNYRSAMLDKKRMSNLKYSYKTEYMDSNKIWNAYEENDNTMRTGISGIAVFDSSEITVTKIPAPLNSGLNDITYYGNVDKILTISRTGDKKDGYPIITTGQQNVDSNTHNLFIGDYQKISSNLTSQTTGVDPVRIKYKSTPHAVLALNYTQSGEQRILPTIQDSEVRDEKEETWNINLSKLSGTPGYHYLFWDKEKIVDRGVYQEVIDIGIKGNISNIGGIQYGWLWLGELYNDNVQNRFGGQTEEAFENNQWLPCGDSVSLIDNNGIKDIVTIEWTEGDTYYQRYDHLKTYPFTFEDQNAITEIVSFMCETRVNLDGRYDRNRGQLTNFAVTPTNFNLINDVYSQQNNFFNYRAVSQHRLNSDNFHNSITWTKTKTAGELIDTWTNITVASTLDLDGDKGNVRAIRRFNNNLIAFQDRGISQILYNENMQIASTEGVPIEIANSGKVNGKRYLSDKIGCTNKWSLCETSRGIYFIDDITKGIYLFNGNVDNLSNRLGFHSWINTHSTGINIWNPVDFNGFVTYYDKINGDVFFISKDECLAFSEPLGQFTSFYSYEHMPYFANLENRGIALNTDKGGTVYKAWLHNEGEYNMFFNKYCPFYTTVIANPDMSMDKIFNTLEFRADSWNGSTLLNTTFDTLTTWNEYQKGTSTLNNILGRPSELKKKFRIWRANIPRDESNGRDRMRNPWLYIKLSMEGENTNKTILHDMVVHYFE